MEQKTVIMSAHELAEYEQFKAASEKRRAEELRRQQMDDYRHMVDQEITSAMPLLRELSEQLADVKRTVYDNFRSVIALKGEVLRIKDDQRSHTFTTSDGRMRITLGVHITDAYLDTVEEGIAIVREYLSSLAKDDDTRALVEMVNKLLSRDAKGTLKASRVIQLRQMAERSGNDRFLEGIRTIEEAYQPAVSKQYVRAEVKDKDGAWTALPLGMTEA